MALWPQTSSFSFELKLIKAVLTTFGNKSAHNERFIGLGIIYNGIQFGAQIHIHLQKKL